MKILVAVKRVRSHAEDPVLALEHDLYAGWHEVGDARRQPDPEVHVLPICELTSDARRQLVPR